jgi:hypothetical protein
MVYRAKPVPITKLKPRTFYGRHSRGELWNVLGFKNLPSNQFRRVMGRVPHFHMVYIHHKKKAEIWDQNWIQIWASGLKFQPITSSNDSLLSPTLIG